MGLCGMSAMVAFALLRAAQAKEDSVYWDNFVFFADVRDALQRIQVSCSQ